MFPAPHLGPNFPRITLSESGEARIQTQPVLSTNKLFCLTPFPAPTNIHFTLFHILRISISLYILLSHNNVISISPVITHKSSSLPVPCLIYFNYIHHVPQITDSQSHTLLKRSTLKSPSDHSLLFSTCPTSSFFLNC